MKILTFIITITPNYLNRIFIKYIMNSKLQNNQDPVNNIVFNEINTKISDYSLDDILNMLEIRLDKYEDYDTFQEETNEKINH